MVQMLARDLKLCEHRTVFKELIEYGIPVTRQDVVLIFVTVTGIRDGLLSQVGRVPGGFRAHEVEIQAVPTQYTLDLGNGPLASSSTSDRVDDDLVCGHVISSLVSIITSFQGFANDQRG